MLLFHRTELGHATLWHSSNKKIPKTEIYTFQSETCTIYIILPAEKVPVCWTGLLALCQISHSAPPCSPPLPGSPTADASGTQLGKLLVHLVAHGNL